MHTDSCTRGPPAGLAVLRGDADEHQHGRLTGLAEPDVTYRTLVVVHGVAWGDGKQPLTGERDLGVSGDADGDHRRLAGSFGLRILRGTSDQSMLMTS
jgi:hypothetical protein